MGGHGHGHGPPYVVPSPNIYKVEDVPQLVRVQQRLAEKGLKDPWLRNEVWRYTTLPGTPLTRALRVFLRGARFGIPTFIVVVSIENYLGAGDHGHGNGDHH
ncbi:NADH dehydrogenase [ubiquinone] 1 beta subcomplex subunit 3 [Megachile rotundata]|uniref:NADH dehydrogenase [ubiquinone] 1 beta subcomplex subunit 3 n=1 Tax=Megachile rotundata TaxID=143995 RepID=UPI000258EEBD|nr:PREDICTED: NADH dehydrogenase [ubiquinone] 1 beta subcomplex subunit 3 [Megachile rotundata]XP_012147774.1 PREDICTED: NADH dehydrogenase [ubiquinone] 1 beta subcomplex subunit 3 [Megachile rotundata]XP_012147775.1 PREDICTED: NADH dehydrogenase [ubiquinone] 1 beta subcomplex subunit 3 [Megachile rotundata]